MFLLYQDKPEPALLKAVLIVFCCMWLILSNMKRTHLIFFISIWVTLVTISFFWNYSLVVENNSKVVLNKSQAFFDQIVISRSWNAFHGGVYVPINEFTEPNEYLDDPLKNIIDESGRVLTKINPAFMTRQVSDINKKKSGVQFHITSLIPIRPGNEPDSWETTALKSFEKGSTEILELVETDTTSNYRYMAPLITETSCLKCHAKQGYTEGDIRGGISISFSSKIFVDSVNQQLLSLGLIHLIILVVGIIGLFVFHHMLKKFYHIIKNKNTELLQINATKDKFFTIIAHDLKSPFNSILGFTNLLINEYDNLDDEQRVEFINEIDKSSKSSFNLLENLLLWARSQRDGITINKTKNNVSDIINDAIEPYMQSAELKEISVTINLGDDLIVNADKFTLITTIRNLFSNAIKFTPQKGKIEIVVTDQPQTTNISISDTGVGIPDEILPKLFQIDENITTPGTENEKGTGLGLLLCKEFINKNGGDIIIESEVGRGTMITFTIPKQI